MPYLHSTCLPPSLPSPASSTVMYNTGSRPLPPNTIKPLCILTWKMFEIRERDKLPAAGSVPGKQHSYVSSSLVAPCWKQEGSKLLLPLQRFLLHHSHPAKASPSLVRSQHALNSRVPVISDQGQKASASLGSYQMCISWHSNKEPHRITTSARWRGVSDLLVVGAQSNTFSPSQGNRVSLCLPLRCEITTQWEESLSEEHFYDSFSGRALRRALCSHTHFSPVSALWE